MCLPWKKKAQIKYSTPHQWNSTKSKATTRMGTQVAPLERSALKNFLIIHVDIFAQSHEDMPGINTLIIQQNLCINPKSREVKWKRRTFSSKKNVAIIEQENGECVQTSHISTRYALKVAFLYLGQTKLSIPQQDIRSSALWMQTSSITR